jgi:hypothetical protein
MEPIMDQATFERELQLNKQAYEKLREQIRRDYAGQYVGIAEGRLIAAANTFEEVEAAMETLQPVPEYSLIFPADEEPPFEPCDSFCDPELFDRELQLNRQAYETMREQIRRDYAGQYVGIAEGKLIAVAPSFNEVRAAIEGLKPAPDCFLIFEAGEEPIFDTIDDF